MKWLDDHFIHLIAPNIYRTPAESLQTFNYITDKSKFTWWQRASIRYSGAAAMYVIGRRLKKKYEITDERKEIHNAISEWMKAIHDGGSDFLNGEQKPGVVDLSMYGVLKAIETFDTFDDLRKQNADFASWYDRVKEMVGVSTQTLETWSCYSFYKYMSTYSHYRGAAVSNVIVSPFNRILPSFWFVFAFMSISTASSRTTFMYSSKPFLNSQ